MDSCLPRPLFPQLQKGNEGFLMVCGQTGLETCMLIGPSQYMMHTD